MGCSVAELLERFSSTELTEWMAYENVYGPIGPARADLQAGVVASTIANVNRGKRGKSYAPSDFVIQWDGKPAQTPEEQLAIVRALNASFGGTEETNGDDD